MAIKKLTDISDAEIKARGVVSLADKPNSESTYGTGGLTPTQLKLWFDKLGTFLAGKINSIHAVLGGSEGSQYIQVSVKDEDGEQVSEIESLQDLIDTLSSGDFATFLMLYADATAEELQSLQTVINNIAAAISENAEAISSAETTLQDNIDKKQDTLTFDTTPTSGSTNPVTSGGIYTALSSKVNTSSMTSYGTSVSSSISTNSTAYTVKVNLLNSSGTQIGTTTISIPVVTLGTPFYDGGELIEGLEFDDIIQSMPYAHMSEEAERAKSANTIKVHSNISSIGSGNKNIEIVSELPAVVDDRTIYIVVEE